MSAPRSQLPYPAARDERSRRGASRSFEGVVEGCVGVEAAFERESDDRLRFVLALLYQADELIHPELVDEGVEVTGGFRIDDLGNMVTANPHLFRKVGQGDCRIQIDLLAAHELR